MQTAVGLFACLQNPAWYQSGARDFGSGLGGVVYFTIQGHDLVYGGWCSGPVRAGNLLVML